eukprot:2850554-Amphidinium_carterae.1
MWCPFLQGGCHGDRERNVWGVGGLQITAPSRIECSARFVVPLAEAKIRQLFQAAISSAPSLLFLDEVDAITPKRDTAGREMERRMVGKRVYWHPHQRLRVS